MSEISKQALKVENSQSFPNNSAGLITPSDLRAFNEDMIDSLVDEIKYNEDSASWNQSIDALEQFTSSQQPSFTALNAFTASQLEINSGVNLFTQSADGRLDTLESEVDSLQTWTGSVNEISDDGSVQGYATRFNFTGNVSASIVQNVGGAIASIDIPFGSVETGSFLVTASFSNDTRDITFTKADASQFSIGKFAITGSNTFTGVQTFLQEGGDAAIFNGEVILNGGFKAINSFILPGYAFTTPLLQSWTDTDLEINPGGDAFDRKVILSGSLDIEKTLTASLQEGYVWVGDENGRTITVSTGSFGGGGTLPEGVVSGSSQIILQDTTGDLSGSRIDGAVDLATSASHAEVADEVPFDGITGKPTLVSGSSQIVLQDTTYTDGVGDQFLMTDGAGNLSFDWVKTLHQNIHNATTSSIVRGTPLYISGSTGDNANVYFADASNTNRRPATLIAYDATLAPGATGTGIISGEIQGVDTNLYPEGTIVYLGVGGGWSATRPTGSDTLVQALGVITRQANNGRGIVFNQIGNNLPNIQEGYAWVGDSTGVPVAIATSSFGGSGDGFPYSGSAVITGSLSVSETIKSQVYINPQTLTGDITVATDNNAMLVGPVSIDGTLVVEGNSNLLVLSQVSGSGGGGTIDTGSFATTGSNSFLGTQDITGSLNVIGSSYQLGDQYLFGNYVQLSGSMNYAGGGNVNLTGTVLLQNGNDKTYITDSQLYFQNSFNPVETRMTKNGLLLNDNTGKSAMVLSSAPYNLFSLGISDYNGPLRGLFYNTGSNTDTPTLPVLGVINGNNFDNKAYLMLDTVVSGGLEVSGSATIGQAMSLTPQDPLPSGNVGDLAVSGSSLYFYNGAWTLIV